MNNTTENKLNYTEVLQHLFSSDRAKEAAGAGKSCASQMIAKIMNAPLCFVSYGINGETIKTPLKKPATRR